MGIEWIENPRSLRIGDGSVLTRKHRLTRSQARQLSGSRRVVASNFPHLEDVTDDRDRIQAMLSDYAEESELFTYTACLYSGDGKVIVVFDYAH